MHQSLKDKISSDRPVLTADAIVFNYQENSILLIERQFEPLGWALPGGFVDYGESLEQAVVRELREETSLEADIVAFFKNYSNPKRDPRYHMISAVYIITPVDFNFKASSDAVNAKFFKLDNLPLNMAFDHLQIIKDFGVSCLGHVAPPGGR